MGLDDGYQPLRTNILYSTSTFVSKFSEQNNQKPNRSRPPKFTHYNVTGHTVDSCFELNGYPANYKKKSNIQRA